MSDRPRRIFFLGIGGTLMGSLALLAREWASKPPAATTPSTRP